MCVCTSRAHMSMLSIRAESTLLPMVYECVDMQQFIDAAAALIGTPIRFSPDNDLELAFTSPGYPASDIDDIRQLLADDELAFHTFLDVVRKADSQGKPIYLFDGNEIGGDVGNGRVEKIFCNIAIGTRYYGNLSIPRADIPLETVDGDLVATIAHLVALMCAAHGVGGFERTNEDAFRALLFGAVTNSAQLALRVRDWKAYENREWRMICVALPEDRPESYLRSAIQRIFLDSPVVSKGKTINVLFDIADGDIDSSTEDKLRELAYSFKTVVLVSGSFDDVLSCLDVHSCMQSFPQMRDPEPGMLVSCDRYREFSLFWYSKLPPHELERLMHPAILAMSRYDEKNGTEYLKTLRTYAESNKNVVETAANLSVHANTVNYRVKRMRELFGIDLSDADTLFEVMLAFRLRDFIG